MNRFLLIGLCTAILVFAGCKKEDSINDNSSGKIQKITEYQFNVKMNEYEYFYNANGSLNRILENGFNVLYVYSNTRVYEIVDNITSRDSSYYDLNQFGKAIKKVNSNGIETEQYFYDASNQLVEVIRSSWDTISYEWSAGNISKAYYRRLDGSKFEEINSYYTDRSNTVSFSNRGQIFLEPNTVNLLNQVTTITETGDTAVRSYNFLFDESGRAKGWGDDFFSVTYTYY